MLEVREEKERLTREAESNLAQKAKQLEEKWQEAHNQLQETLTEMQNKHQVSTIYLILSVCEFVFSSISDFSSLYE